MSSVVEYLIVNVKLHKKPNESVICDLMADDGNIVFSGNLKEVHTFLMKGNYRWVPGSKGRWIREKYPSKRKPDQKEEIQT